MAKKTNKKAAVKRSTKKKHPDITDMLRKEIETLSAFTPLPGERELARRYEVTPITIRKSLRTLEEENRIYSIHRKGTFVAKTMQIAVFNNSYYEDPEKLLTASFYKHIYHILEERKTEYNWDVKYVIKDNPLKRYPRISRSELRHYDGIMSIGIQDEDYIADLEAIGLPVVVADYWPVLSSVDAVSVDGRRAGAKAAEILYDMNHEYLVFIGHMRGGPTHGHYYKDTDALAMEEGAAYMAQLRGYNKFKAFYPKVPREEDLAEFTEKLLMRKDRPTGFICTGSGMAAVVAAAAKKLKLKIPQDLSLIILSIEEAPDKELKPYSRLVFSLREMGEIAIESMLQMFNGRSTGRRTQIIPRYVKGTTVDEAPR